MIPEQKEKLLKLALRLFGVTFILVYPIWLLSSQKPSEAPS